MIDANWNRTPLPRFETELTYKKSFGGTDELNVWANGLSQQVGRSVYQQPNEMENFAGIAADKILNVYGYGVGLWGRFSGFALGGTYWAGKGLGTATAFGNTAVDEAGELRQHFGYLAMANYRLGGFEIAASYGSANVKTTAWDNAPLRNTPISVAKEVRGISGMVAYHVTSAVTFSVDAMNLLNTWDKGEKITANIFSGGMLAEW